MQLQCVGVVPGAPAYEFDKLSMDAIEGSKVLVLFRDRIRGREYEGELEAMAPACS